MVARKIEGISPEEADALIAPAYARRGMQAEVPKYRLPDHEMLPQLAYDIIHDELMLDGHARLNMATFVTTWMEPQAERLMTEAFDKNLIDKDEYPRTAAIEERCINIVSNLFNAPDQGVGASAIGSSEAVMLAGMALKWRWRDRRRAQGQPTDRPNLVLGANVQVVWEKFCRYWEVEPRYIPMEKGRYVIRPDEVLARTDENTIGVVAILGTTFTGEYEPIEEIHAALAAQNASSGLEIPMHVDAASGGFVAPFLQPDLKWDFRLPMVKSINVSGHKYGLVYPGIGWVLWRSHADLPDDLVFRVNYLGGDMPTFTLNFSRPGNQVIGQYYNFLRLGRAGYTQIMEALRETAITLARGIAEIGPFELVSDGSAIPVFAFKLKDEINRYNVFDVSRKLRESGWQVPAYTMPEHAEAVAVLRIVIREGFSADMAAMLLEDIRKAVVYFDSLSHHEPMAPAPGFAH
ncbi:MULTISPECIES: glutamate decarboxylase [unclassified Thiocapsa]|uniref:glutamate decarboxylase n=1 Tax=unclassified Thiocapsa TaxID=2641286 RepID=UPI0035B319C3